MSPLFNVTSLLNCKVSFVAGGPGSAGITLVITTWSNSPSGCWSDLIAKPGVISVGKELTSTLSLSTTLCVVVIVIAEPIPLPDVSINNFYYQ